MKTIIVDFDRLPVHFLAPMLSVMNFLVKKQGLFLNNFPDVLSVSQQTLDFNLNKLSKCDFTSISENQKICRYNTICYNHTSGQFKNALEIVCTFLEKNDRKSLLSVSFLTFGDEKIHFVGCKMIA